MNFPRSERSSSNINASATVDSALSLSDIFKGARPHHKDFRMTNNNSINCVSEFSESSAQKSTAHEAPSSNHESTATNEQYKNEPTHRLSVESQSLTIKLNDLDCPPGPASERQRLFAEKRKKKTEKHIYSHPAMIAALFQSDDDDE